MMLVTGGPPNYGGAFMPRAASASSLDRPGVAHSGRWVIWKDVGDPRKVTDVPIDDAKKRGDGGLVCGDRIEIAHG
jgi:hypothetical protein